MMAAIEVFIDDNNNDDHYDRYHQLVVYLPPDKLINHGMMEIHIFTAT